MNDPTFSNLFKKFGTDLDPLALFQQMASVFDFQPDKEMLDEFTKKADFIRKTGEKVAKAMPAPVKTTDLQKSSTVEDPGPQESDCKETPIYKESSIHKEEADLDGVLGAYYIDVTDFTEEAVIGEDVSDLV
jgi:hypothetical protein